MLERIIDWSLRHTFFVILAAVMVSLAGVAAIRQTPIDAIPDLSDVQVIILTEFPGQAPRVVEDQVTYPITTQMLAVPFAKVVRGYSFFGLSFVYVIFEDGTDLYWARSRVLEYLNYVGGRLPSGVSPSLGPDATGVGWAFMYALKSTERSLADLRSLQDWFLKYELTGIQGSKTERLINILSKVGAAHYISGPAARAYLDEGLFKQAGITLEFMIYNYPEYEQLYPPYEPAVSILDLLFMSGPKALDHILSDHQDTI